MANTIQGRIKSIVNDTVTSKNGKQYEKASLVLDRSFFNDMGEKITRIVPFEFFGENAKGVNLDAFEHGCKVEIEFVIGGHEYKDKLYPEINGLSIKKIADAPTGLSERPQQTSAQPVESEDNMPF